MFEYMSYNIAPWGSELSIYFFLIGISGMSFVMAAAPSIFSGTAAASVLPLQRTALMISFVVLLVCGVLLILDLGQPGRFMYPIIYFHWTSPLSWGALFLPLFGACIVGFFYGLTTNNTALLKPIGILGSLLGLSMPLYTGNDLMVNNAREVWNSPWTPVLFTVLSVSSGGAVLALVSAVKKEAAGAVPALRTILFYSVGVTFFLFLGFLVMFLYGSEELQAGWAIINSEFGSLFWFLTFAVGIVLPLVLLAAPGLSQQPAMVGIAGLASLVGAYTFRDLILIAGQLPQLYY